MGDSSDCSDRSDADDAEGPLPQSQLCKHGCHFSTPETCRNTEDGKCACKVCHGECAEERCDECIDETECVVCSCCGDEHKGPLKFPDHEECGFFDEDVDECFHCKSLRDDLPSDDSQAEEGAEQETPRCEYHVTLAAYTGKQLELERIAKERDRHGSALDHACKSAVRGKKKTHRASKGTRGKINSPALTNNSPASTDNSGGEGEEQGETHCSSTRARTGPGGAAGGQSSGKVAPPLPGAVGLAPPLQGVGVVGRVAPPLAGVVGAASGQNQGGRQGETERSSKRASTGRGGAAEGHSSGKNVVAPPSAGVGGAERSASRKTTLIEIGSSEEDKPDVVDLVSSDVEDLVSSDDEAPQSSAPVAGISRAASDPAAANIAEARAAGARAAERRAGLGPAQAAERLAELGTAASEPTEGSAAGSRPAGKAPARKAPAGKAPAGKAPAGKALARPKGPPRPRYLEKKKL